MERNGREPNPMLKRLRDAAPPTLLEHRPKCYTTFSNFRLAQGLIFELSGKLSVCTCHQETTRNTTEYAFLQWGQVYSGCCILSP